MSTAASSVKIWILNSSHINPLYIALPHPVHTYGTIYALQGRAMTNGCVVRYVRTLVRITKCSHLPVELCYGVMVFKRHTGVRFEKKYICIYGWVSSNRLILLYYTTFLNLKQKSQNGYAVEKSKRSSDIII